MTDPIDPSDVPTVSVRELVLTVKLLAVEGGTLTSAGRLTESDIRRVEQTFWKSLKRDRTRKTAALLRFRSLVEVCRARRITELLANHGQEGMLHLIAAAASMRLNASWGFNPQKLARAVHDALRGADSGATMPSLAAA